MIKSFYLIVLGMFLFTGLVQTGCALEVDKDLPDKTLTCTGLEINVSDGQARPLRVLAGAQFHVEKIDIKVTQPDFPAPDALDYLIENSDFGDLDWSNLLGHMHLWEQEGESFSEFRGLQGAKWMKKDQRLEIAFLNAQNNPTQDPVLLDSDDFLMVRPYAFWWAEGAVAESDYGTNTGNYTDVTITTEGVCSGDSSDVYSIKVVEEGPLDETAKVDIVSIQGDGTSAVPVASGMPISLGSSGATITFSGPDSGETLSLGDSWIVRCNIDRPAVGAPDPGTRAHFSAVASLLLLAPRQETEIFYIPPNTAFLELTWSQLPMTPFRVPLDFDATSPYDYGFEVDFDISAPASGNFFEAGEELEISLSLKDKNGVRLHPQGQLPTYRQFMEGDSAGIAYYSSADEPCMPYWGDCRLNIFEVEIAGPSHRIEQSYLEGPTENYFSAGVAIPAMDIVFGGFQDPDIWDTPLSDRVTFKLPADAFPGSYVAIVKASRVFKGEASHRMVSKTFQVGSNNKTEFNPKAENCDLCHTANARLTRLRHGSESYYLCVICHQRPHGLHMENTHQIHMNSPDYLMPKNDCTPCHVKVDSNRRASVAACGSCHGEIHPGEDMDLSGTDRYSSCAAPCHQEINHVPY
jgi:hypothetical protein